MKTAEAVKSLAALAQDTRLSIYRMLVQQGRNGLPAGAIAERLGVPAATLSFHLKELAHAGMIQPRQDGRFVFYSANYTRMNDLLGYLSEKCCHGEAPPGGAPAASRKRKSA